MPVDNERKHGGVAEPIRRLMAGMLPAKEENRLDQLKALHFLYGRNVLIDYYVYRVLKFPSFRDAVLEDVFEGGGGMGEGIDLGEGCFEKLKLGCSSSEFDP
jgi:hypothetical protein